MREDRCPIYCKTSTGSRRSTHASSTSQHEPRARAASQVPKIAESCKRSSLHARDRIIAKIPADDRDKEACHGAAQAPPPSTIRVAVHTLMYPSIPPRSPTRPHDRPDRNACASSHTCIMWLAPSLSRHHRLASLFRGGHPSSSRPTVRSIDCQTQSNKKHTQPRHQAHHTMNHRQGPPHSF
jgi:hypothetical protein